MMPRLVAIPNRAMTQCFITCHWLIHTGLTPKMGLVIDAPITLVDTEDAFPGSLNLGVP